MVAIRPVGIICRRPFIVCDRTAATCRFGIGSPYSSTMRPRTTLPRGREKSIRSMVWPSLTFSGVPPSSRPVCPYDSEMYGFFDATML